MDNICVSAPGKWFCREVQEGSATKDSGLKAQQEERVREKVNSITDLCLPHKMIFQQDKKTLDKTRTINLCFFESRFTKTT